MTFMIYTAQQVILQLSHQEEGVGRACCRQKGERNTYKVLVEKSEGIIPL
jgi:hypothetical protein